MKCSRIARGFGCGSSSGFVAEVRPKAGLGFRARAVFPVWKNSDIGYRIKRSIDELISKQALALGLQKKEEHLGSKNSHGSSRGMSFGPQNV